MSISEEALRRGSAILADVGKAGIESEAMESGADSARAPTLSSSSGRLEYSAGSRPSDFRTARGDEVSISEALRRGSAILADVGKAGIESETMESGADSANAPTLSSSSGRLEYSAGSRPSGFRTARGDEVSISEEALRRGSAILADVGKAGKESGAVESGAYSANVPTLSSSSGRLGDSVGSRPSGFRTARGDEVSILEEFINEIYDMVEMR